MDKYLLKTLYKLRSIEPDTEYAKRSRLLILSSSRYERKIETQKINILDSLIAAFRKPAAIAAVSGVFILVIILSASYINQILSPNNLVAEADEITALIQVRLDDVKYNIQELENKNLADLATLNELKILLNEATNELEEAAGVNLDNEDLEMSLQKMRSAYEILQEMSLEINKSLIK